MSIWSMQAHQSVIKDDGLWFDESTITTFLWFIPYGMIEVYFDDTTGKVQYSIFDTVLDAHLFVTNNYRFLG